MWRPVTTEPKKMSHEEINYKLIVRPLLWEQGPDMLVPPEQSLVWNQALFSCVRWLSNHSGQWICLPLVPKLQSISDGTLVLHSSLEPLEDTAGYNVGVLLIMPCHPVSHLPDFCAKIYSPPLWGFFLICQHVKAPLSLLEKAKVVMSAATRPGAQLDRCDGTCS